MSEAVTRLAPALADRYRIEHELGQGGMATVYLAHDVRHDRKVALKVLRPELAAILGGVRFLAEIKTTANLQHPHILSLHDSGEADGVFFYVMPYIDGESVRDRLTREKQLPVDDAVRIAREVASALDYAHRHGVVHRDIKPENILLHDGTALVADFGIALAASRSDGGTRMTETGMSLGTPHYMSPEQAMGEKEITPKADIYALGCVLYEMLTGEPPFTGPTAQAIIARVMTENPRSLTMQRRTVPPHIEAVVRKALEKLPADRFASAAQFVEALDRPGSFVTATTPSGAAPLAERLIWQQRLANVARRSPWLALGAAAGIAAMVFTRERPMAPPVARFAVPLTYAVTALSPSLSPDGSQIVFVGVDSTRTQRLFLRPLAREAPVPIAGTEGVSNSAYFSPDGQWIVFRQASKLRKVALAGGAALAICDIQSGPLVGLSWGSRDVIAFSQGDTLYRVSAAGGIPEAVMGPDSATGALRYWSGRFLPDGRRLVAMRITARGPDLVVIDIERREATPLNIAGMTPHYLNAGRLLYADQSGTLLAVPFDARRARVTGPAEPVVENVTIGAVVFARYGVAADNGTLVYYSGTAQEGRQLVLVDRAGRAEVLPAAPTTFRFPRFSPDGRRIAVGVQSPLSASWGDIWDYELASQRLTRLTFDTSAQFPEWSPDGRGIIYARRTAGSVELYRVAADGSTDPAPFFSRRPSGVFESQLMPDGRNLVFREDANIRDILIAPVDSPAAARPLAATAFNERSIALSPDGRWLAFVSDLSGRAEVYVRRIEDGSPRWKASLNGGVAPRWGPLGRELFFRNFDTLYVVSAQLGAEARLGEPRPLFAVNGYATSGNEVMFDLSPDGRRFVMVRFMGSEQVNTLHVVMHRFDGSQPGGGSTTP